MQRWPHRKLKSLDKLKEKLEKEEATAADKEYYKHEIHSIVQKKDHIFRANPTTVVATAARDNYHATATSPTTATAANMSTSDAIVTATSSTPMSGPSTSNQLSDIRSQPASFPISYMPTMPPPDHSHHPATLHSQHHPFIVGSPMQIGTSATTRPSTAQPPPHHESTASSMVPSPLGFPPPHISLCGIIGCDCYFNGGVSSQNLHMPIAVRPPGPPAQISNSPMIQPPHTNPHGTPVSTGLGAPQPPAYYGVPPGYAYAPHMPYAAAAAAAAAVTPAPFHNMVQVNVMDHQSYAQHAAAAAAVAQASNSTSQPIPHTSQPLIAATPTATPIVTNAPPGRSPQSSPNPMGPSAITKPYDVYTSSQMTQPVPPSSNMIYGGTSTNGQLTSGVAANSQQPLATHYWSTDVGQTNGTNNTFTMYNQSTHYHHHHSSAEQGHAAANQTFSSRDGAVNATASTATNNSDAGVRRRLKTAPMTENGPAIPADTITNREESASAVAPAAVDSNQEETARINEDEDESDAESNHSGFNRTEHREDIATNGLTHENGCEKGDTESVRDNNNHQRKVEQERRIPNGTVTVKSAKPFQRNKKHRRADITESTNRASSVENSETNKSGERRDKPSTSNDLSKGDDSHHELDRHDTRGRLHEGRPTRQNSKRPRHNNVGEESTSREKEMLRHNIHMNGVDHSRMNGMTGTMDHQANGDIGHEMAFTSDHEMNGDMNGDMNGAQHNDDNNTNQRIGGFKRSKGSNSQNFNSTTANNRDMVRNQRNYYPEDPPSPRIGNVNGVREDNQNMCAEDDKQKRVKARNWDRMNGRMSDTRNSLNNNGPEVRFGQGDGGGSGAGTGDANCGGGGGGTAAAVVAAGGSCTGSEGTSNACHKTRAKRYELVVHGCVGLGCAQWCADKSMRVIMALGAKALLAMLGVGSVGRNILDGQTDAMVENANDLRLRYASALKGQRFEWIVTQGRKRFIIVLAPFRRKIGSDIGGVSGLILEINQGYEMMK